MEESEHFQLNKRVILVPLLLVFLIWLVYWIEIKFNLNFTSYGVYPKKISGLKGIIFSPFIHSGISHLVNNSIPLVVLTASLFFFYNKLAFRILFFGMLLTGFLTWIIGRPSYHIGASGIIYMLVSFLFFSGIFRKYYRLIALSLVIVFLYGSMFWYLFPIEEKISWEGHLSGFLVGFFFAIIYKNIGPQQPVKEWEEDEFDLLFDEDGNYNPPKVEEDIDSEEDKIIIKYNYKKNQSED